uniref:Uncharacterized protein n=1 Tax=Salix viminalis TaxID=40686 RepID=A0A6N2MGU8_SALVM
MPSTPSAKINRSLQQLNCHVISSSKTSPVKTKTTCFVLFCGGLSVSFDFLHFPGLYGYGFVE